MIVYNGKGIINSIINKLPVEIHIPGYQYCGPGTKLEKRLKRGDLGINPLDAACKRHDIAYSQNKDLNERHKADKVLEEAAWSRVKSKDAKISEKAAAWAVTNAMKVKRKMGMGISIPTTTTTTWGINKMKRRKKGNIPLRSGVVMKARKAIKKFKGKIDKPGGVQESSKIALSAAKIAVREAGGKKNIRSPRIISIPKQGGILPLIPIFAGLSALGTLAGGAAGIAKAVNSAKDAKQKLKKGI